MKRREFLAASAAGVVGAVASRLALGAGEQASQGRQLFELRTYHFASPAKRDAYEQFMAEVAVPALNRAGIEPVGVFKLMAEDNPKLEGAAENHDLTVLLPHNSMDSVIGLEDRLAADQQFQQAGRAILSAPKSDPAYTRYDSTLLLAMEGRPRAAATAAKAPSRVFELRTYESRNVERARNKLDMFNAGEFQFFEEAGMNGVFYGGAIVGANLPQLTYMVVHPDMADAKKDWARFSSIPAWKKLLANPSYKDNVSHIIDLFLRPAQGSQI